jgi:hypothetical protein
VASDVSLTVHAGASLEVGLSKGIYLRPDVRARYFEKGQNVDLEASLAIGFRIGG